MSRVRATLARTDAIPSGPERQPQVPPAAVRWKLEAEAFVAAKQLEHTVGERWIVQMRYHVFRFPELLRDLGEVDVPTRANSVTSQHLDRIRKGVTWERATLAQMYAALRNFLRWAKNPLSEASGPWRLPSGQPTHRRWVTRDQMVRLFVASLPGPERLLIALEGLNGLRRVEALRLRVKDVLLEEGNLRVLGKGRDGGKWRSIPMHPRVRKELEGAVRRKSPLERLLPFGASRADFLLRRVSTRAGLHPKVMISHHDLRRTFGRLAHEAGIDLVQLQHLYGHGSVDMTAHYIGLDTERLREGLEKLARYLGTETI